MRRLAYLVGLSLGAGHAPFWPGTFGAAVGLLFAASLMPLAWPVKLAGLVLLFVIGVWASAAVAADTGLEDPQIVVVDESFGAAAVVLVLPFDPLWWAAGFIAFRAFDILKPFPVNWVQDTVKGGLGIMLDDAAAALYAILLLLPASWLLGN